MRGRSTARERLAPFPSFTRALAYVGWYRGQAHTRQAQQQQPARMAAFGRVGFSGSVPDLNSKRGKSTCLKRARDFRACLPPPFLTLGVEINSQKRIDIAVVAPSILNPVMSGQEAKVESLKDTISRLHVSLHSMGR